jgi:hypothetical protein
MSLAAFPKLDKKVISVKLTDLKKALTKEKNPKHQNTLALIEKVLGQLAPSINAPFLEELNQNLKLYAKNPKLLENEAIDYFNELITEYEIILHESYLGRDIWYSPDEAYSPFLQCPKDFKPKQGGAKNAGLRTGVYTFADGKDELKALIKQGNTPGETMAEYIGSKLYELTIPDYSARCLLVRDTKAAVHSVADVYVGSIFPKGEVQDAFKAAGFEKRDRFAGLRARLHKGIGSKESAVQKVIDIDAHDEGHSLVVIAANALWQGDHDLHLGNLLHQKYALMFKFIKIDHGFSLANLDPEVVDIFASTAGNVVDVSAARAAAGGKLLELNPTNHYWDLGVEPRFYFDGPFIKACEDIYKLTEQQIAASVRQSFDNIAKTYRPENLREALLSLSDRIKCPIGFVREHTDQSLAQHIQAFIVERLVKRKLSLVDLANNCREQVLKHNPERSERSALIEQHINVLTKKLNANNETIKKIEARLDLSPILHQFDRQPYRDSKEGYLGKNKILAMEREFFNILKQANDMGYLEFDDGKFNINGDFYFKDDGKRDLITKATFARLIDNLMPKSNYKKLLAEGIHPQGTPITKEGYAVMGKLKVALKPLEHDVVRKYLKQ